MTSNRSETRRAAYLLFPSSLCLYFCVAVFADDPLTPAVLGVQQRYAAASSVSADFEQTYRGPGIEQTESGRLWMKKPGLMRWEYNVPEKKLFIADGRDTYLYTPADRQVLVRSFGAEEMHSTPLRFLLGQGEILKSFSASWEREFKPKFAGTYCVRLVPRLPQPEYAFLVMECDVTSFDLRRLIIHEPTGNSSEFLFTGMTMNIKVNKGMFQFKVPRGVEVIRLDEK